jgi:hypothetical protein
MSDLDETQILWTDFPRNAQNNNFYENPSCENTVVPRERTARLDDANSRSSKIFCERIN